MGTEADTCSQYVLPRLHDAGWQQDQISEQRIFTDGRIIVNGRTATRGKKKRADYLLFYQPSYPLAVVEAKADYRNPGDGMQQAKDYAQILGLLFAYSTNGHGIIEFDCTTGIERAIDAFPAPRELWNRYRAAKGLGEQLEDKVLIPNHASDKIPRYYQQIAINRATEAILTGQRRVLLTLATGTGKTVIAFQIAWRLWRGGWNLTGRVGGPRILFLADRSVLVDDPKDKTFAPFGDARHKITNGHTSKSRAMYFATYQAIAKDEARPGLYRAYAPDFFDLIIVDEAHRGSARDDSNWREILEYFASAAQVGMTATPLREDNRDTYGYFGNPVYTYSLRQGIEDGFLAPYQVRRVVIDTDAEGFRPYPGQLDTFGRVIPDREYTTRDFERVISLPDRTEAVARHLTAYLKSTERFAKTIVFCTDQDHADQMRRALSNANADLMREHPDYVVRVTSDDSDLGRGYLSTFQDLETKTPVILTTSQMLTTGVDAPMVKNVVLFRLINSMTEFKQIIGRGTRVREDYEKMYFTILDYTGTATQNFADPDFDGDPVRATVETMDDAGEVTAEIEEPVPPQPDPDAPEDMRYSTEPARLLEVRERDDPRKLYLPQGMSVKVINETVLMLDADGHKLRTVQLTDYTGEQVRLLYHDADDLRQHWTIEEQRTTIREALADRHIALDHLAEVMGQSDADPFDLLCHLAFHAPVKTRRERAAQVRQRAEFFARYRPEARAILEAILDQYATYGPEELVLPDLLRVPALARQGNVTEIIQRFGDATDLRAAIAELQVMLYAA